MEIERKFLLKEIPQNLLPIQQGLIRQSYLSTNPELRIRRRNEFDLWGKLLLTNFKLTIKGEGLLSRAEVETEVSQEFYYDTLFEFLQNKQPINKEFYNFDIGGGLLAECSKVDYDWYYVEVEFYSEEHADKFIPPDWFGKEVTNDVSYKMKNYWLKTRGENK